MTLMDRPGGWRAVLFGPTAYRSREDIIIGGPGTATRGRPEQLNQHRWIGSAAGGRSCLAQRRAGEEKAASMQIPGSAYQVPPWSSYWMRKRPKSYESAARSPEPEGRPTAW